MVVVADGRSSGRRDQAARSIKTGKNVAAAKIDRPGRQHPLKRKKLVKPKGPSLTDLMVARFAESILDLSQTAISRALSAKDQVGFLSEILASTPANDPADERLKQQQIHAARFKRELAQEAGGLLEVDDVMKLMGYGTKQAAYKAARDRRLLAVMDGVRLRFPACQFVDGAPAPGLREVLDAASRTSGWRILQYLLVPEHGLSGRKPIDLLKTGNPADREMAVRFAGRLED